MVEYEPGTEEPERKCGNPEYVHRIARVDYAKPVPEKYEPAQDGNRKDGDAVLNNVADRAAGVLFGVIVDAKFVALS